MFIANLLWGKENQKLLEEIKNLKDLEEEKIYTGIKASNPVQHARKTIKRSISESQNKNIGSLENK